MDPEIDNKKEEIEILNEKGGEDDKREKIKQLKKEIKGLERNKKSLYANAVKLIDLEGKVIEFLDTPHYN